MIDWVYDCVFVVLQKNIYNEKSMPIFSRPLRHNRIGNKPQIFDLKMEHRNTNTSNPIQINEFSFVTVMRKTAKYLGYMPNGIRKNKIKAFQSTYTHTLLIAIWLLRLLDMTSTPQKAQKDKVVKSCFQFYPNSLQLNQKVKLLISHVCECGEKQILRFS